MSSSSSSSSSCAANKRPADASSSAPSTSTTTAMMMMMMECHILPCSIEYTGPLPTANVYFQPTSLDVKDDDDDDDDAGCCLMEKSSRKQEEETDDSKSSIPKEEEEQSPKMMILQAACLRGRGLLSQVPLSTSSSSLHGRLLRINDANFGTSSSSPKKTVHVEACFDTVQEWYHEHTVSSLLQQQDQTTTTTTNSRVQTAMDWCQVAQALHTPLPLLE